MSRLEHPARRRAARALEEDVELFRRAGYSEARQASRFEARLAGPERLPLRLTIAATGRVFGGTYALEASTADPVLPRTAGLGARGRGVVRLQGIAFRARRGDEAGRRLARALEADRRLVERLMSVHFEALRVEPDGRAVIRHMGGSVVWFLFPPLIKGIPLVAEQVHATIAALEAFAAAGRRASLQSEGAG
jgi:hypothetical protein